MDDEQQQRDQAFLNNSSARQSGEISDFEPLVGQSFSVIAPEGAIPDLQLMLDRIEPLPEYTGQREGVRQSPFALLFSGPGENALSHGLFEVVPEEGDPILLFLKSFDIQQESETMLYESIFN